MKTICILVMVSLLSFLSSFAQDCVLLQQEIDKYAIKSDSLQMIKTSYEPVIKYYNWAIGSYPTKIAEYKKKIDDFATSEVWTIAESYFNFKTDLANIEMGTDPVVRPGIFAATATKIITHFLVSDSNGVKLYEKDQAIKILQFKLDKKTYSPGQKYLLDIKVQGGTIKGEFSFDK